MPRTEPNAMIDGFASMQASYTAAKRSGPFKRMRHGMPPQGAGADYHYAHESDYLFMGEVARDLDRNDCVIGQLVDRHVDNVLGGGFSVDPNTGDKGIDQALKEIWAEESADASYCDIAGELAFYDLERMVVRELAVPGDTFLVPTEGGTVQQVESHCCRSPTRTTNKNFVLGVELTPGTRRRRNYLFTREPIDPFARKVLLRDLKPYPAYHDDGEANVLHVYRPKRPTQTRGVTPLAPIIDMAGIHDDLQFAALLKAQLSAFFLTVRNRQTGYFEAKGSTRPSGIPDNDTSSGRSRQKLAPGSEIYGDELEKVEPWSPNIPNAEFFPHVKLILTFLGINLGMPLVLVLLDASETNFSGYRGAIDQARLGFKAIQQQLIRRFHRPYWRMKVHHWAESDRALATLVAPSKLNPRGKVNIFRHKWGAPAWPYIEPAKDAAADLVREANMQSSPTRIRQERGVEWNEIVAETVRDRKLAIETALKEAQQLNATFKLEGTAAVNWRDLAPLPAPERVAISMQVGEPEPEPKEQKPPARPGPPFFGAPQAA